MIERKIYTLTQLNHSLENLFFKEFSKQYFWITAELIRVSQKNGHFYVELADSRNDQTTARSSAVIWKSVYESILNDVGLKETQGILKAGNKVLMNVKIEYHTIYGLKLKIRAIDPTYSFGEIERKRREVIKKLKEEGVFDNQQEIRLPTIIKRIALVGSPETSGYRDFQNELFNHHEYTNFVIKEFPVSVQGDAAVKGIVEAIKKANNYDAEVVILLRGGGSKMDLALFDDYQIAKAICSSNLPVLTGIGHETDEVVADLVAKQHFITPTAVGQFIQYEINAFQEIMRELHDKTLHLSLQLVNEGKDDFHLYYNYLTHFSRELLQFWKQEFRELGYDISEKSRTLLYDGKEELSTIRHQLSYCLQGWVNKEGNNLDMYLDKLFSYSNQNLEAERIVNLRQLIATIDTLGQQMVNREKINLQNQEELLTLLNPLKILSAGYTISTIKEQDIKDREVQIGEVMKTLSSTYLVTSKIITKQKIKNKDDKRDNL